MHLQRGAGKTWPQVTVTFTYVETCGSSLSNPSCPRKNRHDDLHPCVYPIGSDGSEIPSVSRAPSARHGSYGMLDLQIRWQAYGHMHRHGIAGGVCGAGDLSLTSMYMYPITGRKGWGPEQPLCKSGLCSIIRLVHEA